MERGSYSRLDRIDEIQIELTEQPPSPSTRKSLQIGSVQSNHIDYVLVYENEKDTCELDEESLQERRKSASWRYRFERCLENRLGLVLQRKIEFIDEVSLSFFTFLSNFKFLQSK